MTAEEKLIEKLKLFVLEESGYASVEEMVSQPEFKHCVEAMKEYATEQIKKDRERIIQMQQVFDTFLGGEYAVPVEDIEKLKITLD